MGATFKTYTSTANPTSTNPWTHVLPSNMAVGDLIVLVLGCDSSTQGVTASGPGGSFTRHTTSGGGAVGFYTTVLWKWATAADIGATITLSNLNGNRLVAISGVYANAAPASGVAGESPIVRYALKTASGGNDINTDAITVDSPGQLVIESGATRDVYDASAGFSNYPTTLRRQHTTTYVGALLVDHNVASAGSHAGHLFGGYGSESEVLTLVVAGNTPPNAPTLVGPTSASAVLDVDNANRFSWTHSDPDGQGQSAAEIRYRQIGAATWTTVPYSGPNGYLDLAAGTLTPGSYEWQARTADTYGTYGPFSSSEFFEADAAPDAPTITAPINGATVDYEATVDWTATEQDAYQLQVLDEGQAVVEDSGVVEQPSTRSRLVSFPENGVQRTLRVRVRSNGLWSVWYAVTVTVSYTPPAVPTVTLAAMGHAIEVQVTNPTPAGFEPIVTHNRVLVDDGLDDGETLRVAALGPNESWTYWTPRSGLDYEGRVRVVAVGENGTETTSA